MPAPPPSLSELQHAFAAVLAGADDASLVPWIDARGIDPAARLRIYRHAGYATHVDALATSFPAVRSLLGADAFDGLATRHAAYRGSRSGNLQHYGADFADFLAGAAETAPLPWLAELARLEWLRQQVALAADAPPADAQALLAALATGGLALRPCVRVFDAACAVLDLWQHAQSPRHEADFAVPQSVLLWREDGQVAMRAIDPAQAALVQALLAGATFDHALTAALATAPPNAPDALLRPLLEHALFATPTPEAIA